jgi:hypothetical protein
MTKSRRKRSRGRGGEAGAAATPYEPPTLTRVDLPNLDGRVIDDSAPLLAQGHPSSNVENVGAFGAPPPP